MVPPTAERTTQVLPSGVAGMESAYALLPDGKGFVHELKLPWKVVYAQEWTGAAGQTMRLGLEFLWGGSTGRDWPLHRYADNMQPGVTGREFYWTAKNAWGDLTTVAESIKEPRKYVEGSLKPRGTIPVRVTVPAAARTFTVALDDLDGKRVRNLAGGYAVTDFTVARTGDTATVEVMWDGLDEAGKLVSPGTYAVRGLTQGGIDGYYEMSFYNPGTPPWQTSDKRGAWGADHAVPRLLARSGSNVIIACDFAEGGYGTFAVKPDGTKAWSEIRGANMLAADEKYVYTVPNDWGVSGGQLLRLNAQDGKFVPFVRDGKELPMPLPFNELLGLAAPADGKPAAPPKVRARGGQRHDRAAHGRQPPVVAGCRHRRRDPPDGSRTDGLRRQLPVRLRWTAGLVLPEARVGKVRVADLKTQADPGEGGGGPAE